MKKNKKQLLRAKADKLYKIAVIKKYGEICEVCNDEPTETAHHFFPKGLYGHLRYEIKNGIAIGRKCHFFHHHRGDPTIHAIIIEKRGKKWYNELEQKSKERPAGSYQTISWYQKQIEKLK